MDKLRDWTSQYWTFLGLLIGLLIVVLITLYQYQIDLNTFLAIFIPASVGVIGTYGLYLKRQTDSAKLLRKALRSELEGLIWFKSWPQDVDVPAFNPVSDAVYKGNTDSLGLLSDLEISHIAEFYSMAEFTKGVLEYHRDMIIESESHLLGQDVHSSDRAESIADVLDLLVLSHTRALYTVKWNLDEDSIHRTKHAEDSTVSEDSVIIQQAKILCLEYGLLEEVDSDYRLTDKGESYLFTEMSSRALEKEKDLLGRDQEWYENLWEKATGLME